MLSALEPFKAFFTILVCNPQQNKTSLFASKHILIKTQTLSVSMLLYKVLKISGSFQKTYKQGLKEHLHCPSS